MKLTNKEIALDKFKKANHNFSTPYLAYAEVLVGSFVYSIIAKQQTSSQTQADYFVYDRNTEFYPMLIQQISTTVDADQFNYNKGYHLLSLRLQQGTFYVSFFYQQEVKESIVIVKVFSKPPFT